MKKALKIILMIIIIVPIVTVAAGYGVLWYNYRDTFMPGLFVNSVYAADMTVRQVNDKLKEDLEIPQVTLTNRKGEEFTFSMSEADYDENYTDELTRIKQQQTVVELVERIVKLRPESDTKKLTAKITYDEDKLIEFLDAQDFLKDDTKSYNKKVEIRRSTSDGYYLYDETGEMLNHKKAREAILEAVRKGDYNINLDRAKCYEELNFPTPDQEYAKSMWIRLKPYMETEVVFDFTDRKITVNGGKIAEWIKTDEDGKFILTEDGKLEIDEDAVREYVKTMCELYSTVNKPRTFKATRGDKVTIEKGTYGSRINYKAEADYLLSKLSTGVHAERTPEYSQLPFSGLTGLDDIGNTYIEVDMSAQHLYYYVNGHLKLDSDVVTGNTSLGRGTPERVCYVYFKQRNRTLHGEDYDTFVNYWMAVYNNIGIHDANWRGRFGGSIYRTAGSHGCVNTPIAKVKELYAMVEVGTPVLLYY